jgi:hypothetical protein
MTFDEIKEAIAKVRHHFGLGNPCPETCHAVRNRLVEDLTQLLVSKGLSRHIAMLRVGEAVKLHDGGWRIEVDTDAVMATYERHKKETLAR